MKKVKIQFKVGDSQQVYFVDTAAEAWFLLNAAYDIEDRFITDFKINDVTCED